jgi:hypothetical protein
MSRALIVFVGVLGCTRLGAEPSPSPDAVAAPAPFMGRIGVVEFGPISDGKLAGATVALHDPADLGTPMGVGTTDAGGYAQVPSRATERAWVAHITAEGHRDLWITVPEPITGDFHYQWLPVPSDEDWLALGLPGRGSGLALVAVQTGGTLPPGTSLTLRTAPPAAQVVYMADGLTPDPTLEASPTGQAAALVKPGPVRMIATVSGNEHVLEVVGVEDSIAAAVLHPRLEERSPRPVEPAGVAEP